MTQTIKDLKYSCQNDSFAQRLVDTIILGMLEKKASDVVVLDLRGIKNAITDFFVICSGNNDSQVDAITDSVEKEVFKRIGEEPWKKEGSAFKEWIILDYIDVVVHIFRKEKRIFYGLEELWGDAKITRYPNIT
ncbi:MAG: ribosome silencing factor [Cytophagales bacterium]|nr:ribosome silencing factor [Cytophagales bacterium]MDW8385039.1 ribosome silencing factor [Flammeovirgaceae bacterium]